jgi:GT2 family glycosyltransferase
LTTKLLRRVPAAWAERALADELLAEYDHRMPRDVDYVIGACQVIRREAFADVGPLDEQFFYGPEDVDYAIRMWQNGWRVTYVPQALVRHDEQRLTQRRVLSRLTLTHAAGLARYFRKHGYVFTRPVLRAPAPTGFRSGQSGPSSGPIEFEAPAHVPREHISN